MRFAFLYGVAILIGLGQTVPVNDGTGSSNKDGIVPSFDTSSCPGYKVSGPRQNHKHGFTLPLTLAGPACHAYSHDITNLTLAVIYEKPHQLHVHIYDTDKNQYQLPDSLLLPRAPSDPAKITDGATADSSDLQFHDTNDDDHGWAFWITRKGSHAAPPLFDTRRQNIPVYREPLNATANETRRNSTAMPNHAMIFENQYLQLSSALPKDANLYGLGERYSGGGIGDAGWRLDPDGMLQPFFTLDAADPPESNVYGYHPTYMEVREEDEGDNQDGIKTHIVAYQNTAGLDVILRRGLIQYRAIGGTLDFRFFSGNAPTSDGNVDSFHNNTDGITDGTAGDQFGRGDSDVDNWVRDTSGLTSSTSSTSTSSSASSSSSSSSSSVGPNTVQTAMEQYVQYVGLPIMNPMWSFGFHMLRWGYANTSDLQNVHQAMRDADIPLEVMWSDIDYLEGFRDFTIDPQRYKDLPSFVQELKEAGQRWIPIIDAAIPAAPQNDTDVYLPGTKGLEQDIFLKNDNGTAYIGQVWPGYTYFADNHAPNVNEWWHECYANLSKLIDYAGIWQDMNEISSFCVGSCGNPDALDQGNTEHVAATSVDGWPEGYDNNTWGNSGNITVNGEKTYSMKASKIQQQKHSITKVQMPFETFSPSRRQSDSSSTNVPAFHSSDYHYSTPDWNYQNATQRFLVEPPYAIHNGIKSTEGPLVDNLNKKTIAMEADSVAGKFYDLHNIDGSMLIMHTYNALRKIKPNERPFIVGRSTYPGVGKYTNHWLGDNYSLWQYLSKNIQGLLQFQLFGIPTIGADTCGFNGNTNEELCNRWMMLSAFSPFYRNHNTEGAISQEPYRWDSVANASRIAIFKRLELLPEIYTARARSSQHGTPMIKSLWYEFSSSSLFDKLKNRDSQFMLGSKLLISPVLEPNVNQVKAFFPNAQGFWRNIFTHEALYVPPNQNISIPAPLSTINVHMRPGTALLTHAEPKYTVNETSSGPYGLLINLNNKGEAEGDAYIDDGVSMWPTPSRELRFKVDPRGTLQYSSKGKYTVPVTLEKITVMGMRKEPKKVEMGTKDVTKQTTFNPSKTLINITGLGADLNKDWSIDWSA